MIIQSFNTSAGPFESPFAIAPDTTDRKHGHITVLIGENGVRKSLALRLLMDASLGKPAHAGHGHPEIPIEITCDGRQPDKVIAISLTPWDRFPRSWALAELASSVPSFGYRFAYIGPRSREGMVSPFYNEAALGRAMLENVLAFKRRSATLAPIFEKVGLSSSVGIRFGRRRKSKRSEGGAIDEVAIKRLQNFLMKRLKEITVSPNFSDHWKRTISEFVVKYGTHEISTLWRILDGASSDRINCWITPAGPICAHGFKEIQEWRCALYLGLFEVNGVFFTANSDNLPTRARGALRESNLSSGQWNWLYNLVSLCVELDDNSLVLIDEPENSLHPRWQREFISALWTILASCSGCHAVVATHSALIASGVRDGLGNVRRLVLREDQDGDKGAIRKTESQAPLLDAYGAQVDDVYRELFDLESTRTPEFISRIDNLLSKIRNSNGESPVAPAEDINYIQAACARLPAHDPMRGILRAIINSISAI